MCRGREPSDFTVVIRARSRGGGSAGLPAAPGLDCGVCPFSMKVVVRAGLVAAV